MGRRRLSTLGGGAVLKLRNHDFGSENGTFSIKLIADEDPVRSLCSLTYTIPPVCRANCCFVFRAGYKPQIRWSIGNKGFFEASYDILGFIVEIPKEEVLGAPPGFCHHVFPRKGVFWRDSPQDVRTLCCRHKFTSEGTRQSPPYFRQKRLPAGAAGGSPLALWGC